MKIHTAYFDDLKDETDTQVKFGDHHTTEFDVWIPKKTCVYRKLIYGYEVRVPVNFAEENKIL